MVKYSYQGNRFIIEDFQKAKTFSSFLPAVSGTDGKPIWTFYCNVGQALSSFGITSKESPIIPFESAHLAYQNIATKSFRTFLKINGRLVTPFFTDDAQSQQMSIGMADFSISEVGQDYRMDVFYSTVPSQDFASLIRKVTITNTSSEEKTFEGLDGLPIFFPQGLSNYCYKELVSLMAAYCQVYGLETKAPFVKFKTSTGDNSMVSKSETGNAFFAFDADGKALDVLVDPAIIFGSDLSLLTSHAFEKMTYSEFLSQPQQTENKLPCAFVSFERKLKPQESFTFYAYFGMWDTYASFEKSRRSITPSVSEKYLAQNEKLIDDLVAPATTMTSYPLFDRCLKQSYLDNNLRGGFPVMLPSSGKPQVYYVFGRKHGDMERDYNAFEIPSRFYSSGPGNFRDVNQNRRNDLFFAPFVFDYNIHLFFDLIQVDGQNPLNVRPESFTIDKVPAEVRKLPKADQRILLSLSDFEPSDLYSTLREKLDYPKAKAETLFKAIIGNSTQKVEASFAEGYWIDHWTYNVDLLENFSAVFPDKEKELFFTKKYSYFYSPVYVEPRSEKYCLLPDGKIRQYGAIDLNDLREYCERKKIDLKKTDWLKDANGKIIKVDLASKIANLILIKFSTLDSQQMGIEMECEKPGWNDAMNGLPGLFSSGLSETTELLRLVRYARLHLEPFTGKSVSLMPSQKRLFDGIRKSLCALRDRKLSRFAYWDHVTSLREKLRKAYRLHGESHMETVPLKDMLALFDEMDTVLSDGLIRAKQVGKGILPTYLIYDVAAYEELSTKTHLGYPAVRVKAFHLVTLPPFLEASARTLKLADNTITRDDVKQIRESDLYDKKLHFYKTCAAIDDAPFEIGRVHAFTKGWLERECNFLHMDYKYLLGLLKAGYYQDFYQEVRTNWVLNSDPFVYGRDPAEASSFIVPTCNPDSSAHGQGFFARLTGANAEFLNMAILLFAGESIFSFDETGLHFHLNPKLSSEFFDKDGYASFLLFSKVVVRYHNPQHLNCYAGVKLSYRIDGKDYDVVPSAVSEQIRNGTISNIDIEVKHD
jgi:hypothetical protein